MHLSLSVALATIISATSFLSYQVNGHGYLKSPRSRNWFAHEDGSDGAAIGVPKRDYCPHCLNTNPGDTDDMVCGQSTSIDYNQNWKDSTGNYDMPWISQGSYTAGEYIQIDSYLDTHHNGHCEVKACDVSDGSYATQSCFDAHPLKFHQDLLYGMPADPNYPNRGYYYGGQGGGVKSFSMSFELPYDVHGDKVLLQWRYITANSCSPPGYAPYFAANPELDSSFWTIGLTTCQVPYGQSGARDSVTPEQFWNCAEVSIANANPTISPAPSPPPTTRSPTTPESRVDNTNCADLWGDCTNTPCCSNSGSTCVESNQWYSQCLPSTNPTTPMPNSPPAPSPPTMAPIRATPNPVPAPATPSPNSSSGGDGGPGCCTHNWSECIDWCGSTKAECESCSNPGVFWLENGVDTTCVPRYSNCKDSGCCNGLTCNTWDQCVYEWQ